MHQVSFIIDINGVSSIFLLILSNWDILVPLICQILLQAWNFAKNCLPVGYYSVHKSRYVTKRYIINTTKRYIKHTKCQFWIQYDILGHPKYWVWLLNWDLFYNAIIAFKAVLSIKIRLKHTLAVSSTQASFLCLLRYPGTSGMLKGAQGVIFRGHSSSTRLLPLKNVQTSEFA